MDNVHVSEWKTVMVNFVASIFIENNIECNDRNNGWPRQTLSEIPPFQRAVQLLNYNLTNFGM